MEANNRISVIVPNYNNAQYISRCLKSILEQTYTNIEIIVIDDCSTDDSRNIIRQYADRDNRIVAEFNDENIGVALNRHKGILQATGAYISTLDSDDIYYSPVKLEKEYSTMLEQAAGGKGAVIAFSGIVLLNRDESKLGLQNPNIREGNIINDIVRRTCLIPRDFLFTRDQYLKAGGFDKSIRIYEDWDLKIRLAVENNFYYSGIDGIGYRRHGQGLSAASPLNHIYWLGRIFIKNFHLLRIERVKTVRTFSAMLWRMFYNYLKNRYAK